MTPPAASMAGTTFAQYWLSIVRTSVGGRVSLNDVKFARSANSTLTWRSCVAEPADRRIDAEAIGHGGGEVRPERRVEPAELAGSLDEERDLVAAGSLLAEVVEDGFGRLAPFVGGGDLGDGPGVPAVDPAQRRLEVEAAEGRGQRAAPAILLASPERDRHEGEQHQHVPLPPAQPPVAAQRHGGDRLGQEHEGDRDGHGDHAPAALVDAEIAPRGVHVQRDATKLRATSGPVASCDGGGPSSGGRSASETTAQTAISAIRPPRRTDR